MVNKFLLSCILVLNMAVLGFSGFSVFKYFSAESVGNIEENETVLCQEPARVRIISEPGQAKVFVNGYYKGFTPTEIEISNVDEAIKYRLTVVKNGYRKWEKDIDIYHGSLGEYTALLEKIENENY